MLMEKPWKAEAILRLIAKVVLCIFMGTLVSSVLDFFLRPPAVPAGVIVATAAGGFVLFAGALVVLRRSWAPDVFGRKAVLLLVCFYGGLSLTCWHLRLLPDSGRLQHSALDVLVAVASFQGALLVMIRGFLREHQVGWTEAFGFHREVNRALVLGLAVALLFVPIGLGLQSASGLVLEHLQVKAHEQDAVHVLRVTQSWADRLLLGLSAILVAPAAEEILFRGILYPATKRLGFPGLALWGTSVLFGAIHLNLVTFVPLTVLALGLCWLYEKTNNLLAPISAHALFNAVNFAALFVGETLPHWPANP